MKSRIFMVLGILCVATMSVQASTVAYWRFEEGPDRAQVSHGGMPDGVFYEGTADSSGNGYGLSVWTEGWAGYEYRSDVGISYIPLTGQPNQFAVKNTGGYPTLFTSPDAEIRTITPSAFTIEATFKLENGGWRTIVGRDSRGAYAGNPDLAALYFQATPGNRLAIKFCDVSGYWHEAVSAENVFTGFDWGTNPDGIGVPWYSMAAVSDGSTLSLYLLQIGAGTGWQLIAQTDISASGSPNTALTMGQGSGNDWIAGTWTVGRGMYAGGHTDRAYGFLDEVRISDTALSVSEFLIPEPASIVLVGLGALGLLRRSK
ncbi:MAG: PEP-CTERM sorting domain-containing protein [Anaerohalosphaeraceae bacterium]